MSFNYSKLLHEHCFNLKNQGMEKNRAKGRFLVKNSLSTVKNNSRTQNPEPGAQALGVCRRKSGVGAPAPIGQRVQGHGASGAIVGAYEAMSCGVVFMGNYVGF